LAKAGLPVWVCGEKFAVRSKKQARSSLSSGSDIRLGNFSGLEVQREAEIDAFREARIH
jgi:hypothetical protein